MEHSLSTGVLAQLVLAGLTIGSIYALVAIGYNIIYSTTHIMNFAQGELVMLGAMVGFTAVALGKLPPVAGVLIAAVSVGLLGLGLERVAYWPLQRTQRARAGISWIITTLGVAIILQNLATRYWGSTPVPAPSLFRVVPVRWGAFTFDTGQVWVFLLAIALALGTEALVHRTLLGKAFKATSFNREAAEYMGINTSLVIFLGFGLSGALAAIAGVLVAPLTFASTAMGLLIGLKGFAVAILGGLGSGRGAIVAGLLMGVLENVIGGGLLPAGFRDIAAFGLLILALAIRPEGLFGEYTFKKA